ncbi:type IV pilin-like G/H family protein [Acaryochloris sp. IP29b_bin.148]|uniref:type IV pilin-like G/H family protein n=1 Tax=Acaryochloris sp. IP29b_bin.148 TaxID=2969218 RepID=UPI002602F36E|nr:type IV pilin-like G/H family protein [Acaryochloris sp. IP29b_bin.148]
MSDKSWRYPAALVSTAAAFLLLASCSADTPTSEEPSTNSTWQGTWELKDPASGEKVTFVLHPDQKVYLITPDPASAEDQVIEVPLTKVSDQTALPENIKPISLFDSLNNQATSQAIKARDAGAKNALGAINRAQQAYRLENPTFATSYTELGIEPFEDESFDIEIVSGDANRAYATATAKSSDTKSFSGVVTIKDGDFTTVKVCETESASQTPPPIDCE